MATIVSQYEQLPPIAKLLIAAAAMGGTFYWYWEEIIVPKGLLVQEKQRELDTLTADLKAFSESLVSPLTLEEELNRANRDYKKMIELLPIEPAVEKVLNDFASLSRITATEIREFMPNVELNGSNQNTGNISQQSNNTAPAIGMEAPGSSADVNSVAIGLKLNGTFTSLVSFLDLAMSLPRVIRIKDFEITNTEKELKLTQRPKLAFNGKFFAYFQRASPQNIDQTALSSELTTSTSETEKIGKPLIDLNDVIDKSFSAKGTAGGSE